LDEQTTLAEVKRLLELLPGVRVRRAWRTPEDIHIRLAIAQYDSLARLACCTAGANVGIRLWSESPSEPESERSNPEHLRYELRIRNHPESPGPPTNLQVLGVFLVRELNRSGTLGRIEANRLLGAWNTMSV
jgi:hypothetical protein